jgi:hypothetical protein
MTRCAPKQSGAEKSALIECNAPHGVRRPGEQACAKCGATFVCGMSAGVEHCWCADLPPLMPLADTAAGCYCPDCLRVMLDSRR